MKLIGRSIAWCSAHSIARLAILLVVASAGVVAVLAPASAAADAIVVSVDEEQSIHNNGDGSYTATLSATLRWTHEGQPNGYLVKRNGVILAEYDSTAEAHVMLTMSLTFPWDDLAPAFGLEILEDAFLRMANAEGLGGYWEVETTCGVAHGDTSWWPTGVGIQPPRPPTFDSFVRQTDPRRTVTYSRTLFTIPCRGTNVDFTLLYNAQRVGPASILDLRTWLPKGWTHSLNVYVKKVDLNIFEEYPHNFELHLATDVIPFVRYPGGTHFDCPEPYVWFEEFEDEGGHRKLRIRLRDTEYLFSWYLWAGARIERITTIKERTASENLGHSLQFTYDSDSFFARLQSIQDSSGRVYKFNYWETSEGAGLSGALKSIEHPGNPQTPDVYLARGEKCWERWRTRKDSGRHLTTHACCGKAAATASSRYRLFIPPRESTPTTRTRQRLPWMTPTSKTTRMIPRPTIACS